MITYSVIYQPDKKKHKTSFSAIAITFEWCIDHQLKVQVAFAISTTNIGSCICVTGHEENMTLKVAGLLSACPRTKKSVVQAFATTSCCGGKLFTYI